MFCKNDTTIDCSMEVLPLTTCCMLCYNAGKKSLISSLLFPRSQIEKWVMCLSMVAMVTRVVHISVMVHVCGYCSNG